MFSPRHSANIVALQSRKIGAVQVGWTDVDRIVSITVTIAFAQAAESHTTYDSDSGQQSGAA